MRRLPFLFSVLLFLSVACSTRPRPEVSPAPDAGLPSPVFTTTPEGFSGDISPEQSVPSAENTPPVSASSGIAAFSGSPSLGIHIDDYSSPEQLTLFLSSGAEWSRFDRFYWDLIEPVPQTPAVYDWSSVDEAYLSAASGIGVESIGIVLFAPAYAQKYPGSVCGPIAEEQLERFGQFLYTLVGRYSQPPYNVKYWEIGNEPDVDYAYANRHGFGCWGDPTAPYFGGGYYAHMLRFAYPLIKAADPQAQVLIGGLLLDCDPRTPPETSPGSGEFKDCSPALFLDGILENGGGDYFDGISFHAYDYYSFQEGKYGNPNWHSSSDMSGPVALPKAVYLQQRLEAHGVTGKYLLNTESALICGRDGKEASCQTAEFARTKAAYTVHTNTIAFQLGLRANIWYSLMGWRASELLNSSYTPLPAYDAFRFNVQILNKALFKREVLDYPQLFVYEFETESGNTWILWSKNGETASVLLPSVPLEIYDLFGNPLPSAQEVSTNYSPLYIKFPIQ